MGFSFSRENYMRLYERVKKVDVGAELTVVRIYIRETCRRDMHSLTFSREIYKALYEKIIIYLKGEDFMRTFLSIALLVYLVMSAFSVGYSIWWLSIVAKEMRKTNKTINEINNTQIK